jgi:protease YdgD
MRILFAAAVAALCLGAGFAIDAAQPEPGFTSAHKQEQRPEKPGARPGDETCRWSRDNECDEPVIGTGACPAHTDYSDCRYIRYGESDDCSFANDGECDEPHFGTGACTMGSDRSDCGDVSALRFRNDSCLTAFNGVCEEPGGSGSGCAARTDRTDCIGRERPMSISDHFFGRDDRMLLDTTVFPWSVVGEVTFESGPQCTATLIGPDILVTAAHCIMRERGVRTRGEFLTATGRADGGLKANVIGHFLSPRYSRQRFEETREVDGLDWALLRIDQRLGDELGFVEVRDVFSGAGEAAVRGVDLYQAGFSWDTGVHLSGNVGCHALDVFDDNTFSHECDTTHGDSGSPFMVREGESYRLVGVDSRFRSNPGGSFIYVAVGAGAFASFVNDFASGRVGSGRRRGK